MTQFAVFYHIIPPGIIQGLILALVTFGVWISFRLLNFPDLSAEGSYLTGATITAVLIGADYSCTKAIICSCLAAGIIGISTALINLRLKVNSLLAGFIVSSMAYSINLRILIKPNLSIFETVTIFNYWNSFASSPYLILLISNLIIIFPLFYFLKTERGLRFRAIGLNPVFAQKQGINLSLHTILGLFLSSSIIGLAGSLVVQYQEYVDINLGIGIALNALAALIIGETIFASDRLLVKIFSPLIGASIYQQVLGISMTMGLAPTDLKLFTGIMLLLILSVSKKL